MNGTGDRPQLAAGGVSGSGADPGEGAGRSGHLSGFPVASVKGSRGTLADLIAGEIAAAGMTQHHVAQLVGISDKHLSQVVTGRCGMSLDLVDRVLGACRRRLVLATVPIVADWHACPACWVERTDYEGPDEHLPACPNCDSTRAPVAVSGVWL